MYHAFKNKIYYKTHFLHLLKIYEMANDEVFYKVYICKHKLRSLKAIIMPLELWVKQAVTVFTPSQYAINMI